MTAPDIEALAREFCELTGKVWHHYKLNTETSVFECQCGCGHKTYFPSNFKHNPDLRDARQVMKVVEVWPLKKRADFHLFLWEQYGWDVEPGEKQMAQSSIPLFFVMNRTGLLLKEAVEWMRGRK